MARGISAYGAGFSSLSMDPHGLKKHNYRLYELYMDALVWKSMLYQENPNDPCTIEVFCFGRDISIGRTIRLPE